MREDWSAHLESIKPLFELAGMVLTAAAWSSISLCSAYMAIYGYLNHPSPALENQGVLGQIVYWIFSGPFILMAILSSALLLLAVWSMVVKARIELELSENVIVSVFAGAFRLPYYISAFTFIFMLIAIPSFQILQALGYVPSPTPAMTSP